MNTNKIIYDPKDHKAYSRSTIYIQKQTNKLLSYSLIWLGLGILFIGLLSFAILSISPLFSLYMRLVFALSRSVVAIILWIVALIAINFGIFTYVNSRVLAEKPKTSFLAFLYFVFVLANSLFLPMIFAFYAIEGKESYIMIAFAGAGGLMSFVALLGYFNAINFGKLLPFILVGFLIEFTLGIVSYFVFSSVLSMIYSLVGITVTLGMIGYQFWMIRNQTSQILAFYDDEAIIKRAFMRIAIWNALSLYISFIRLIMFLLRLLNSK